MIIITKATSVCVNAIKIYTKQAPGKTQFIL